MAEQIVNAAPMVIDRGTQDLSTRLLPREPELIPQHLPKFYLFTEKGPLEPQLVVGNERDLVFGSESFNLRGKYANHSTVFSNLVNAEGNACMIQRVIADDAGPESNIVFWLDVLAEDVDLYQRGVDGKVVLDGAGDPTVTGTAPGYKIKWVVSNRGTVAEMNDFGTLASVAGDQVNGGSGALSVRYPIFEIKASALGESGNLAGLRMWAPTVDTVQAMPIKMMTEEKAYPYFISVIRKATQASTAKPVETLFGENKTSVTFKNNVIDPLTDADLFIGDVLIDSYQNISDPRYATVFGDFGDIKVYEDNIDVITGLFHTSEVPFIDAFSDITSNVDSKDLMNIVSGVSSFNVRYHSIAFVDSVNSVRPTEFTNIFAQGGSDGTIDNATHALLVKDEVNRYLDPNDQLQDLAVNVESIIYDTGFPLDTKFALCSFIAKRKDTMVVLGTHEVGERTLTASEEHSVAIALRTRLQSYPESDYFGTPVMRGMIMGRSGKLRNSQYTKELPLTAEVAVKSAKYMGASNGRWKNGSHFDGAPGSIIDNMFDINITWVPADVRNRNWDVGLNWVQAYDRKSYFFPALKTIYDDDTSVLNSYFTAMAIAQLNKVSHACWREFSGVSNLTNAQLVARVNNYITEAVKNKFDGRFVIQPDALFTDLDVLRGYSWTLPIKIFSPNLKTVMTTYVQAFRIEDLQ